MKSGRTQTERSKPREANSETNTKTKISPQEDKIVYFSGLANKTEAAVGVGNLPRS